MIRLLLRGALLAASLGLSASFALAVQPDEMLKDTQLESRARTISAQLRCLVCQNQSIDDSDAPLARDLRILVAKGCKAATTIARSCSSWSTATAISSCSGPG